MKTDMLDDFRRLVVKVGSNLIVDEASGRPRTSWMDSLADDVARLCEQGKEVVLVSSGAQAMALYAGSIDLKTKPRLADRQALAAAGQIQLCAAWQRAFAPHKLTLAQALLTLADTERRRSHINAREAFFAMFKNKFIPLVNENDTLATAEIRYGDNDRLAARVAIMLEADGLVLLSDVDGLYDGDPRQNPNAQHMKLISAPEQIDQALAALPALKARGAPYASGGMATKLQAARLATQSGCRLIIADGCRHAPLSALQRGARCTLFEAVDRPQLARKKWIATAIEPMGALTIDEGAWAAIRKGKSLLPAGLAEVKGQFERGDVVTIGTTANATLAKGLAAWGSNELQQVKGAQSQRMASILGIEGRSYVVHRDDLVLL